MSKITPLALKANKWREFSWNGGTVMEYWKPLADTDFFDSRIGVRFGEYRRRPYTIYIFSNSTMIRVGNCHSISYLEFLWRLMRRH
jgi:hypothetical protein